MSSEKTVVEKAATINHLLYNADYILGKINLIYHDIEKAEEYFIKCLDSEELDAKAYFELSKIYMLKNEREKAIIFINKAIELDRKMYKKSEKEPVFIPIRKYVILPVEEKNLKEYTQGENEKKVEKHLDRTFNLIEGMGIRGIADTLNSKIRNEKNIEEENDINKER